MDSMSHNDRVRSVLGAAGLALGSLGFAVVTLLNPYAPRTTRWWSPARRRTG